MYKCTISYILVEYLVITRFVSSINVIRISYMPDLIPHSSCVALYNEITNILCCRCWSLYYIDDTKQISSPDLSINNGKLTLFLLHMHEPKAQVQYHDHAFSVVRLFVFQF